MHPRRPVAALQILRIDEDRWNAIILKDRLLVLDSGHVVWPVGHPRVLDEEPGVLRQREVRMPDPMLPAIMDDQGPLVEEGNAVAVQQPADLGLAAGLVRRFVRREPILQAGGADHHPWLTS